MAVSVTPIRDTKWLTLEVCREFQRGTCSRPDTECKFAHPSKSCQVENGRVIACFDSLKVSKYYIIFKDVWLMKEAVVARGTLQPNGSKCWLPAVECFATFILLMLVDLCCCFPQGKREGYMERRENTSGRAQILQYGYRGSFFASKLFPACSWNKGHFT